VAGGLSAAPAAGRERRAGAVLAAGGVTGARLAAAQPAPVSQPLEVPEWTKTMGRPIPPEMYGMPSRHEARVQRRRSDVFVNRQNWSDWSLSPLQYQHGIVTPNGVFFERHHAGTPSIDPDRK
jgi:sulfane dehydrogenase subunit SoxC